MVMGENKVKLTGEFEKEKFKCDEFTRSIMR